MPDFTDKDKETLERLEKAFDRKSLTTDERQPWQEHLRRATSVSTGASLAAEIVAGFSGSWAASYNYGLGAGFVPENTDVLASTGEVPTPVRAKRTKLGGRGVPDVDFVPYNWRTNRFGSKGPSLVGHPISFRVVGPTLKSPFCDHTWQVQEGAGANGGDLLTIDTRPDGGAPTISGVGAGYGLPVVAFTIGGPSEPNGGLYVLITDDGANPGSTPVGTTPMGALAAHLDTARYEIFRVASVRADEIELHPNKPLGNYFDLPGGSTRHIRAITLLQPYVTRLAAVPGSGEGVGRERTFVVVSPETAASSDLYPPFDGGNPSDGSWVQGGFESTGTAGDTSLYGGEVEQPVPTPIRETFGTVEKSALSSSALAGQFIVENVAVPDTNDVGRILHIYHIDSDDEEQLSNGTRPQALGWFEVIDVNVDTYTLARVAEVEPTDGSTFFGPGPYFINAGDPTHFVYFTVHEPVRSLWEGAFSLDDVDSARLRNLIDPVEARRARKQLSDAAAPPRPAGSSPVGSDRAIFDTRTDGGAAPANPSNPGSLLDLGFRMVLFPAKDDGGGNPIPNFDRPIESNEIVIDPLVSDTQTIERDYSGGVVRLSHAPPSAPGGDIVPDGIVGGAGTTNPRGEVVLFAACVPYSMEPSQLGTGARVVGGTRGDVDSYSERIFAKIDTAATTFTGSPPHIGASGIVLDRVWDGPPTGVVDILTGDVTSDGVETRSFGTWGYSEVDNSGPTSVLLLVSSEPTVSDPTPGANDQRSVVLRREVFFGRQSGSNAETIDDVRWDTAYGSSQRARALRFPGATLTPQLDGSVRVDMAQTAAQSFASHQWGYFTASKLPRGNALSDKFYSESGIVEPLLYQDNANPLDGSPGGGYGVVSGHGPRIRIASLINSGDFKGVITESDAGAPTVVGVTTMDAFTRLTAKFTIVAGGEDYMFFVGLIGTATGVTQPDVDIATDFLAPPADIRQVGLRVNGTLTDEFTFFGLGSGGPVGVPTGVFSDGTGIFYFVLETSPGPEARYGLFDGNFNLLAQSAVLDPTNLPADADSLHVVKGIRKVSGGAPRVNLDSLYVNVLTRFDLVGPPLLGP